MVPRCPSLTRALVEVCCSRAGGLLGTWMVLRRWRSSRTRPGRRRSPAWSSPGPWGCRARSRRSGAGLLYAAGSLERLVRRRGVRPDAATGLLLVAALALGTILASDAYRPAPGVDRLLFGTLLGLDDTTSR
jgi:manganese/iron transport system permease protein